MASDLAFEQETTIVASNGDEYVTIETWQKKFLNRLRKSDRFEELPGGDSEHGVFRIPLTEWNPVSGVKRKINLSDAQREAAAERLRLIREEGRSK